MIKEIIAIFIAIICLFTFIYGMVSGMNYFINEQEDRKITRTIQCKEIGGTITYENYTWICK